MCKFAWIDIFSQYDSVLRGISLLLGRFQLATFFNWLAGLWVSSANDYFDPRVGAFLFGLNKALNQH